MDYTIQKQIKILSEIKDKLSTDSRRYYTIFMCHALKDMHISCKFLEYSGLKDLWESKGHSASTSWVLKSEIIDHKFYRPLRVRVKKQCIDELIGIKQQLLSQEKQ